MISVILRFIRKAAVRLVLSSLLFMLPGCWDRVEINDLAIVMSSALDKDENGQYRYSVMVPLPGQMGGASGGGGGTGGGKSYYIDSETGPTFTEALDKMQRRMSRQLYFSHRRTIIVGEDLAREGIGEIFDFLSRSSEHRLSIFMVVAKGKAVDLLGSHPKFERFPAEAVRELAKTPRTAYINLKDAAQALSTAGNDPLLLYMGKKQTGTAKEKSEEIQVLGYALFHQGKLVGTVTGPTADGLSILRGGRIIFNETMRLEDGNTLTLLTRIERSKLIPTLEDGRLRYRIEVKARAVVLEAEKTINFRNISSARDVNRQFRGDLQKIVQEAIVSLQNKGSDAAAFGMSLYRRYPFEWQNRYAKRWPEELKNAEFAFDIDAEVAGPGLSLQNVTNNGGSL